jgi:hypothetical protein
MNSVCLCCNKTHKHCNKWGWHYQRDGEQCERHRKRTEFIEKEYKHQLGKELWESMLRYSEMDAEELSELSHKKVQELQQLRKEIREV